jgi:hypothetical protein
MQTPYDPTKKYTMQVHLNVGAADGLTILNFQDIEGAAVPMAQAAAYTKGVLYKTSPIMIQAISPFQIRTIYFLLQQ